MKLTINIILFLIICFTPHNDSGSTAMDFNGYFSMDVPNSWTYIEQRGFDSFVGRLELPKGDNVQFDYGLYSSKLEEEFNFRSSGNDVLKPVVKIKNGVKVAEYVFYCKKDTFNKYAHSVRSNYSFEIIDGYKAKLVTPKRENFMGVTFDSIAHGFRFQISGKVNDPVNQQEFLKAIRTLKFNPHP